MAWIMNISGMLGRRGVAVLIAVVIAIPVVAITIVSTPPAGVYIELKLFRDVGGSIRPLDVGRDVGVAISVLAISSPNYNGSDFVPIYAGKYSGEPIYIPAKGKLLDVAKAWEEEHKIHGARMDTFEHGLIVFVHILNLTAIKNRDYGRMEVARYVDSIPIKPMDIIAGKAIQYTVSLAIGDERTARLISVDRKYLSIELNIPSVRKVYAATPEQLPSGEEGRWCTENLDYPGVGERPFICYRRKYYIGPENLTTILPQGYVSPCIPSNGKMCMKTPIMMIYNQYYHSGTLTTSIYIQANYRSGTYLTWSLGDLTAGLLDYKINLAGYTISDYFEFINGTSVPPESKYWIWILARPIFVVYETYYVGGENYAERFLTGEIDNYLNGCNIGGCCICDAWGYCWVYRANDTITSAITYIGYNVYNSKKYIIGAREWGEPPKQIVDMMFNGTEEKYVKTLNPNETLLFDEIFSAYDAINFELGAPIGAAAAAFLKYYGLITNPYVLAFIAGFSVDIAQEGSMHILGYITNVGDDPGIPNDYNIREAVYIRVSSYEYVKNGYRFKVPIGIYFRSV